MSTSPDLRGQTCLVTGTSSGIGKECAIALARMGATVVCVSRDRARGEAALAEIRAQSGNPHVELILGDLALQRDVRRVAAEFRARHDRLHVLVNNAGSAFGELQLTEDGVERTFALNHMGYFLLTELLLDVLERSAPARIVNVASEGHRQGRIQLDDLNLQRGFGTMKAYGQSKLANILFTTELARRLEGKGVTVNCLHPGVVATSIWTANDAWLAKLGGILFRPFMIDARKGAATMIHLASAPDVAEITGRYWVRKRVARPSRLARDAELAQRLWAASETLVRPEPAQAEVAGDRR